MIVMPYQSLIGDNGAGVQNGGKVDASINIVLLGAAVFIIVTTAVGGKGIHSWEHEQHVARRIIIWMADSYLRL